MRKILLALMVIVFASPVYCQVPGGGSVLEYDIDGDSHGWRNGSNREGQNGAVFGKTGIIEGWAVDSAALTRNRLKLRSNFAEGGETSAQILAGTPATAASSRKWIVISVGHNDVRLNIPLATSKANITKILAYHRKLGKKVMLVTPPRSLASAWAGTGKAAAAAEKEKAVLSDWMRKAGADGVLDLNTIINPNTHLTTDNLHLGFPGGAVAAKEFTNFFVKRGYK